MALQAVTIINNLDERLCDVANLAVKCYESYASEIARRIGELLADMIDLAEADIKSVIEGTEKIVDTHIKKIRGIMEELPRGILRDLRRGFSSLLSDVKDQLDDLIELSHICYLATGNETLYNYNLLIYALKISLSEKAEYRKPIYIAIATIKLKLKPERPDEAHAIAAYGLKELLPIKPVVQTPPWQNAKTWSSALKVSYALEIETKINGQIFAAWKLTKELAEDRFKED